MGLTPDQLHSLFIGSIPAVVAFVGYLGIRFSGKAQERGQQVQQTIALIQEWKDLKQEIQTDADAREDRLRATLDRERADADARVSRVEAELSREREERQRFERTMTDQLNTVIERFGAYVAWAKGGAKPPAPHIPAWIYDQITNVIRPPKE